MTEWIVMTVKRSKNAELIAVSSGKGGVGKSNIATNLAISFARAGHKVCLFDADINLANVNILLGLSPQYTLEHHFNEDLPLEQIIFQGPAGIDIIAGASGIETFTELNQSQQHRLIHCLQVLEEKYDYLLVDTAAGSDEKVLNFLHAVPHFILTITREPTSLTDAFSLLKVLKKQSYSRPILLVINMVSGRKMAKQILTRFTEAVSKYLQLDVRLAGYIVSDPMVTQAVQAQQALIEFAPQSAAAICIESIASRLLKVMDKTNGSFAVLSDYYRTLSEPEESKDKSKASAIVVDEILHKCQHLGPDEAYLVWQQLEQRLNGHLQKYKNKGTIQPKGTSQHHTVTKVSQSKALPFSHEGEKQTMSELRENMQQNDLQYALRLAAQAAKIVRS